MRASKRETKRMVMLGLFLSLELLMWNKVSAEENRPVKVGATLSFLDNLYVYKSQKHFAERPITKEMAKAHIDLCLYNGPGKKPFLKSLKQFNVIWLMLEHEAMNKFSPDVVGKALREYVEQGGGLVINHSPGRYPEAAVDHYWDAVFKHLDMERLHEEVVDLKDRKRIGKGSRNAFFTKEFTKHPVTDNVRGLWFVCRDKNGAWGSHAIKYSDDWKIVVRGSKTAMSYKKDKDTNDINYKNIGFFKSSAPLVAIRELGKGRIVSIAAHKDNSGWNYGIDRWVNTLERGTIDGRPSDMVTLLENALRWAGDPSIKIAEFTKNYKPVEPLIPKYQENAEFKSIKNPKFIKVGDYKLKSKGNGIIGLHSNYSDGKSSVAEYADAAKKAGLNFIAFTDPLELLTSKKLSALREDCLKVSNDKFYACPGIEYSDSSGLRWALFHDRVSFPTKEIVLDGKNRYLVFDGKTILQRNAFGGHQNLYRGAIIDYSALKKAGADAVNLAYFSGVIPKAYEVDKSFADNTEAMLATAANVHRYAPFSFTRIRNASDVDKAAKASQIHAKTLADLRKVCNAKGWGANSAATHGALWVSLGDDIKIERFACREIQGSGLIQIAFTVSSPSGIKKVVVHDADRRILRRFEGNGVKTLKEEFVVSFDRQSYPQMIAVDMAGNEAVSSNYWVYKYHAGLFRCGDNSNLLSQNPGVCWFPFWDCALAPLFKRLYTPVEKKHWHVSEAHLFGFMEPTKLPSERIDSRNNVPLASMDNKKIDFPNKLGAPSCVTNFSLIEPGVVTIIDQDIGKQEQERSYTGKRATYGMCSIQKKRGENPWYRRKHRIYQLVDRIDTWWYAVYKQIMPQYQGGFTIVEGEFKFLKDVKLYDAINLAEIKAANPLGQVKILTQNGVIQATKSSSGILGDRGFASLVSNPEAYYAFFPLKGSDSLSWQASGYKKGMRLKLTLGKRGELLKAGSVLKYRFAVGSFINNPHDGRYLKWFESVINPTDAATGYPITMKQGVIESGSGFLTLKAEKNAVWFTIGPKPFIQDLPIRVANLADNGVAMMYSSLNKKLKPIAFDDVDGYAYAAAPMEKANTLWIGNVFTASNPKVRMTLVPSMKNLENGFLEVHNPTDHMIKVKVSSSEGTPLYGGECFELEIPAGASKQQKLKGK